MTKEEIKNAEVLLNLHKSKTTAAQAAPVNFLYQKLMKGDKIELQNTESPQLYEDEYNGKQILYLLVKRNGKVYRFAFSALGRSVEDIHGNIVESTEKVSVDYRNSTSLENFLSTYKGKSLTISDILVADCKFVKKNEEEKDVEITKVKVYVFKS